MNKDQIDSVADKAWELAHVPVTDLEASALLKDCVFAIKLVQSRLKEAEKDEARINWMQEKYLCADFKYGDPATEVIVIEFPKKSRYRGDLRIDVDTAMKSNTK